MPRPAPEPGDSVQETELYLLKALDCLDGAASEFANRRYDNCANRCYYVCFQAAITALLRSGIRPATHQSGWGHAFVQARFAGDLIHRRKVFASGLRDTLPNTLALRHVADYATDRINEREAARSLRWTQTFLEAV